MAFLTPSDLNTHIYAELMDEITRSDASLVQQGIDSGMAEVKAYLSRYDLPLLFGDTLPQEATGYLKALCKDIACWHLIKLCNPNIDLKLFRTLYEDAINFLKLVQQGKADPDGWPYKPDDPATPDFNESDYVQWDSNTKRVQSF